MSTAIAFEQVSKHYRGSRRYRSLRDDVAGWVRRSREPRPIVKALDEVSFEVAEGESFGIIGANGAGKSTSLKLAARISYPTSGRVLVRGRVGALIEVGTGMHPELTGRENVHLYGGILGLSSREVARRFDEIVEFSGIGAAIDQPVKQFSSGMQLRLAFSIASHLEPDVLLVDEGLAVGDAGFQYRCVERMVQLVREGHTLVLVSHDLSSVETICRRAVLLREGRIVFEGSGREAVRHYLSGVESDLLREGQSADVRGDDIEILAVTLLNSRGGELIEVASGGPLTVRLRYRAVRPLRHPQFSLGISDPALGVFTMASMLIDGRSPELLEGEGFLDCTWDHLPLRPRTYELWGSVRGETGYGDMIAWQALKRFRVVGEEPGPGKSAVTHSTIDAPVDLPYRWRFDR